MCQEEYYESRVWVKDLGIVRCPFLSPLAKTVFQIFNYHRCMENFDIERIKFEANCETHDQLNEALIELQKYNLIKIHQEGETFYFDFNDGLVGEFAKAANFDQYGEGYGHMWPWIRLNILHRDNYTCQVCKKHKEYGSFDVHHKIPYRICQEHEIDNLVTLCRSCHKKLENKPEILKQILSGELTFEEFTKPKPRKRGIPAKKRKPKKKTK